MEGQVTDLEQEVMITNNNPLLIHFSEHNNDLLVLKQLKGALNRIMRSLLGLLLRSVVKTTDLALSALSLFLRIPRSSGIILYIAVRIVIISVTCDRLPSCTLLAIFYFFFFFFFCIVELLCDFLYSK